MERVILMSHNNYTYHLLHSSEKALGDSKGFNSYNPSEDGNWLLADKGDQVKFMDEVNWPIELPQYIKDLGITGCCLTHEQALSVVNTITSTEGGSDGWKFPVED